MAVPARYALERRSWTEAAALKMPTLTFPWARYPWAEAIVVYTRSLGAARTGNVAAAEKDVEQLAALRDTLTQAKNTYWAAPVEVQRRASAAFVARGKGDTGEALTLLRSAADLESTVDKHPVTPAAVVPARELLGDLLLERAGDVAQARTLYTNLVSLCSNADTERPELREAKAFLAK